MRGAQRLPLVISTAFISATKPSSKRRYKRPMLSMSLPRCSLSAASAHAVQAHSEPFRLTPLRPKAHAIEALGVDVMVVLAFDRSLSQKSAEDFADDVLMIGMAATHVVVGADFVFGHDRLGTVDRLIEMGARARFAVTALAPVAGSDGTIYSSTAVRQALKTGEPRRATALLGRPWEIEGRVEHGDERGRQLGFPTANIGLGDYLRPAFGVYAVEAGIDLGAATEWYPGVANLGRRPTVAGQVERLEVHLFDFEGDLYGRHLRVRLIDFLARKRSLTGSMLCGHKSPRIRPGPAKSLRCEASRPRSFAGQGSGLTLSVDYKKTVFLPQTDFPMRGESAGARAADAAALGGDGALSAVCAKRGRPGEIRAA